MTNRVKILRMIILFIVFSCVAIVGAMSVSRTENAFAIPREKQLDVKQEGDLYYCGRNYLAGDASKNTFLAAFSVTFDGEVFEANAGNSTIFCSKKIQDPGTYSCNITVNDGEKDYTINGISVKIKKKEVAVTAYLNGKTELTIKEGEKVYVSYDYDGAIEGDYTRKIVNGVNVRILNDNVLDTVAYVDYLPDTVINNYTVSADHATSKYYSFVYRKTVLNIVEDPIPELTFVSEDTVLVYLLGSFSSASELSFVNVGTGSTSPEYLSIKQKIDKQYDATDIKNKYESVACYTMNVSVSGKDVDELGCDVLVLLDSSARNKSDYKVIAFYNDGSTEVLNARTFNGGTYLHFSVKDLGEFVVVAPVQGITISTYIIVIAIAVVFVLMVIFFVTLFRRKF